MTASSARRDGRIVSPPTQSQLALPAPKANLSHLSVRLSTELPARALILTNPEVIR